jgi:hypothetical protein
VDGTPKLLTAKFSSWLPWVVNKGEDNGLATSMFGDGLEGSCLLGGTWASVSVTGTSRWPSSLQVDTGLAWAKTIDDLELGSDERSGVGSVNISVKEWMNVATDNINGTAKITGDCLPGAQGFGGGAWSRVSGSAELGLAFGDKGSKSAGRAVTVEDSFVTDNNQVNKRELTPADDVSDLLLSSRNTAGRDEDTKDHAETVSLTSSSNVGETRTISAVNTDGSEAGCLNGLNISGDIGSALALAGGGVWGVGHGPLVSRASEGARSGLSGGWSRRRCNHDGSC